MFLELSVLIEKGILICQSSVMWKKVFKKKDYFFTQMMLLKFMAMVPINYHSFLPKYLKWLNYLMNFLYYTFWHFICLHMGIVQCVTLVSNFDKKLDEIIDYLMIGSTYVYGYFIIVYFQLRYKKLQRLMDFAKRNFKKRSAIGKLAVSN